MEIVEPAGAPLQGASHNDPLVFLVALLVPYIAFSVSIPLYFFVRSVSDVCRVRSAICVYVTHIFSSLFRPIHLVYPGILIALYGWVLNDNYVIVSAVSFFATAAGLSIGFAMLKSYYTTGRIIDKTEIKEGLIIVGGIMVLTIMLMPTAWPEAAFTIQDIFKSLYGDAYTLTTPAASNAFAIITLNTLWGVVIAETVATMKDLLVTLEMIRGGEIR